MCKHDHSGVFRNFFVSFLETNPPEENVFFVDDKNTKKLLHSFHESEQSGKKMFLELLT